MALNSKIFLINAFNILLSAVGLHGIWDTSLTVLAVIRLKIFILIAIVWILCIHFNGRAGLKQVNFTAEKEFKEQQKK